MILTIAIAAAAVAWTVLVPGLILFARLRRARLRVGISADPR
jgi:hypothetical protein